MVAAGAEHLAVLDGEQVCGMLSAADLLGLDARSPIALRHTILGPPTRTALVRAAGAAAAGCSCCSCAPACPPRELGRVLSLQHDAIVARLIDFSIWRHGPAPVAWAWLDLGSAARREFTLASDQDNALAYATPEPGEADAVDAYFERLGSEVNDGPGPLRDRRWTTTACSPASGCGGCPSDGWLRTFDECLTEPDESHLIRAIGGVRLPPSGGRPGGRRPS